MVIRTKATFCVKSVKTVIRNSLFPLGDLPKTDVRKIASQLGLRTHNKKDSTGICFIGERKFKDFLETYLPAQPGNIETTEGGLLGRHAGLMYYTYGQRQGLGIGGVKGRLDKPWYVVDKDLEKNILIVGQGNENTDLYSQVLLASAPTWVNSSAPQLPLCCTAKIRYRQVDQKCQVEKAQNGGVQVNFEQPQRAVTPGQYVVFYDADHCLGGAIIDCYLA